MLWDCGHKSDPPNRPSVFLPARGIRTVHRFFVTNYDEDHLSDLPSLRRALNLPELYRNQSIAAQQLRTLKLEGGPISPAMESMLDMMRTYTLGPLQSPPNFDGVSCSVYCNSYGDFSDTNNLSLVTFLSFSGHNFVIPGDLERSGWKKLLENSSVRTHLAAVNVFAASHHGRETGYCREVFDYAKSVRVVVFSDSSIKYATQEMASTYAAHASGITFEGQLRKVLSTRSDGPITWT